MKLPEHLALSFLIAEFGVQQEYGAAGTLLVVAAGNLPDLDTLTLLAGWRVYRRYHRILGHGLLVTLFGPGLLALLGCGLFGWAAFLPLWGWLQAALLAHLLTDICFYRWPVQLLWPVSAQGWGFGLVSWNDLMPTATLYTAAALALCWRSFAPAIATAGIGFLALYLGWRSYRPRPQRGWPGWFTGGWAVEAAPVWRWLTGDFIP